MGTDAFGPLALPAPAWTEGTTLTDPFIDTFLAFLAALLNDEGSTAWASVDPASGKPVLDVKSFNPEDGGFSEAWLPALFMWRLDARPSEWLAADYYVSPSTVCMLWVPPTTPQENRALRTPFINFIAKTIDGVIWPEARTPGWVKAGDPDPIAADEGSLLWTYLPNVFSLDLTQKVTPAVVALKMTDGSTKTYPCVRVLFEVRERNIQNDDHFDQLDGLSGQILSGSDGTMPGPLFVFKLTLASIAPASGTHLGGTAIAVQGTCLDDDATITIGGVACTGVTVTDNVLITAVTPAGTVGAKDVVVTNPNGETATLTAAFTFT